MVGLDEKFSAPFRNDSARSVDSQEQLRAFTLPRGEPLSTAALQARGLSAFRASALARSGWLTHLARGVCMLPGDALTRDGSLAYLST